MMPASHSNPATRRRRPAWLLRSAASVTFLIAPLAAPPCASSAVFHGRDEIASLAFPDSDRVETQRVFLTPAERERIERVAGSRLDSDLVAIYVGYREDELIGYAVLDTHLVRTVTQTLLIVLDADGSVAGTYVMAFHEPPEYIASERWLRLLENRVLSDDLRVGRAIVGITGSTLTARAVLASVRRALAIHAVLLSDEDR